MKGMITFSDTHALNKIQSSVFITRFFFFKTKTRTFLFAYMFVLFCALVAEWNSGDRGKYVVLQT